MTEARFITFLRERPLLNVLLLVGYYLVVTLPHEWVGLLTVDWFGNLERNVYNRYVTMAALLLSVIVIILVAPKFANHPKRKKILLVAGINSILSLVVVSLLFVIKIEVVHFFQYAGFAILCFPLVRHYFQTLAWTTLAGILDEAYQYFYLAPERTLYYDFNDVIANLIGGMFGLIILVILGAREMGTGFSFFKRPLFFILLILVLLFVGLLLSGTLGFYPESKAQYLLVKERQQGFWSTVYPNVTYHVVQPLEGLLVVILLLWGYEKMLRSTVQQVWRG